MTPRFMLLASAVVASHGEFAGKICETESAKAASLSFSRLILRPQKFHIGSVLSQPSRRSWNHSAVYLDTRFRGKPYLNALIERVKEGWRHDERDRPRRHEDWLWRIADHRGITQIAFNQCHRPIYRNGYLSDAQLAAGTIRLASNYVLFSASTKETYICPRPPIVAVADGGPHETWTNRLLQRLTVLTAARYLKNGRDYLRTGNRGRPHRQIHFEMPGQTASEWRRELIATLKKSRSAPAYEPIASARTRVATCAGC